MCHPVRCKRCTKTTWTGCGSHVAEVRSAIPADQWCPGHDEPDDRGWLRRVVGR